MRQRLEMRAMQRMRRSHSERLECGFWPLPVRAEAPTSSRSTLSISFSHLSGGHKNGVYFISDCKSRRVSVCVVFRKIPGLE